METEAIVSLIGSLGFPIVVSLWFMIIGKKAIDKNTEVLGKLKDVIELNLKKNI